MQTPDAERSTPRLPTDGRTVSRRSFLAGAGAAVVTVGLAGCAGAPTRHAVAAGGSASTAAGGSASSVATTSPASLLSPGRAPAVAVSHGRRDVARVALTFHGSGDPAMTRALLDEARRAQAPITVFAVGQWLDQHPELAGAIVGAGDELENHTYTHPTLTAKAEPVVADEIVRCRDVLARLAPGESRYFRPSGTSRASPLILREAGLAGYTTVVDYDVDPLDYQDPGAAAVVERVHLLARPGSIVSLHTGHAGTVQAFGQVVADLAIAGLTPVLVRDLLV